MERKEILNRLFNEEQMQKVNENIEKNRKGKLKIQFVDKAGKPLCGVKVKGAQTKHAFRFGVNLFMLDEMETDVKNQMYKDNVKELFNMGVVPIYWKDIEPERGKLRFSVDSPKIYRRPPLELCLNYCKANGIEPKAHCLNYDAFPPEWFKELSAKEQYVALEERMEKLSAYRNDIPCWEVINETLWDYKRYSAFYDDKIMKWSFDTARKYFPDNELICNESNTNLFKPFIGNRSQYYMQVERELRNGTKIDGIGFQAHYMDGNDLISEYASYDFLEMFFKAYAKLNLPMQITEITVTGYRGNVLDEEFQADMIERLYSYWFSVEKMEAIIYWNMNDGYAAFAKPGDMTEGENRFRGGLVDFDGRKKPCYERLNNLINKVWHTEFVLESDENGCVEQSAFYGKYNFNIFKDYKTESLNMDFSVNDNGKTKKIIL